MLANRHLSADAVVAVSVSLQAVARQESVCRATHRLVNGEPRRKSYSYAVQKSSSGKSAADNR